MDKKISYLIGIIGVILLIFGIWYFRMIVTYILIAAAISVIGQPFLKLINRIKYKNRSLPIGLTASITLILLWFLLIAFFKVLVPFIVSETNILSSIDVVTLFKNLEKPLNDIFILLKNNGFFIFNFIHDIIPVILPHLAHNKTIKKFSDFLDSVYKYSDTVFFNLAIIQDFAAV